MLSIYDVLVLAYMAIHRAFAACYQFIMHSRNWNGKRNFVHLMQFRSLDQLHYGVSLIPILQIIMKQKGNFLQKILQQRSQNWNCDSAPTWIKISRFESFSKDLWCNRITFDTLRAQQGYNGILYYLLILWSFPQITIVVIFLTISGHTACYLQQWYIRC